MKTPMIKIQEQVERGGHQVRFVQNRMTKDQEVSPSLLILVPEEQNYGYQPRSSLAKRICIRHVIKASFDTQIFIR